MRLSVSCLIVGRIPSYCSINWDMGMGYLLPCQGSRSGIAEHGEPAVLFLRVACVVAESRGVDARACPLNTV